MTFVIQAMLVVAVAMFSNATHAGVFDGKPIEIRDLHFGEVLFHFYQDNYFDAIVRLMAAQELGRMPNQGEEVDALLSGFYLEYGLHQQAERELRKLAEKGVPKDVRNRAWIKLGQARYQKGLYEDAIRALEEIEQPIPDNINDEIQLQMGNLLIARGDYEEAIALLKKFPGGSDNVLFAEFNLGIALFKSKQQILGAEHLDIVGRATGRNKEVKALKDKANIALGYALLINEDGAKSKAYFERVRIKGPYSNKALLGLGWANVTENKYDEALTPWMELVSREATDSAVYESMLAVPFALEQLKAYPQSMQSYREAIARFQSEINEIEGAVKTIRDGNLWDKILENTNISSSSKDIDLKYIPESIEKRYISSIVSTHAFHETVKNLQDLIFLEENLSYWANSVPAFNNMLSLRRGAFNKRLPELLPDDGIYKLAALKDEADLYREEMDRIEQQNDLGALASGKEQKLIKKLSKIKDFLVRKKHLLKQEQARDFQSKYRLYAGLLEWEIGSTIMPRRWKIQRELRLLDAEILKASRQAKNLKRAKNIAPRGFEGYGRQIKGYNKKIVRLQKKLRKIYTSQQETMEQLIIDELMWLKSQLAGYLDQARFALARLQDLNSGNDG